MTVQRIDSSVQQHLSKGVESMSTALQMSTGLTPEQRKLVAYWTMATHMLPHLDLFPLLVLRGDHGTGKSTTLRIIGKFAYKAKLVTIRHSSYAVLRDTFAECYEGTAVIEEGDKSRQGTSVIEGFYSDRYQRGSSNVGVKQATGHDTWQATEKKLFGATVMHRRMPFTDAALDGRSIVVNYSLIDGEYLDCTKSEWLSESSASLANVTIPTSEITYKPDNVVDRIFDTYKPLLMCAAACDDDGFMAEIQEQLEIETLALRTSHSFEPDGLIVRAMIALADDQTAYNTIKISNIVEWVWHTYRTTLGHREVASVVRMLGFKTKESGGITVVVKAPAVLLRACARCGYDGEDVDRLKIAVLGEPRRASWWQE